EANSDAIADAIAESRLQGHYLNLAVQPQIPTLRGLFIIADHTERNIKAKAEMPLVIEGAHIIGEGHSRLGGDITLVGALNYVRAGGIDVRAGLDRRKTTTDLSSLQTRHARRVAKHGAGIQRRGGAASETSTHAADALLIDSQTVCHQLA